MKMYSINLTFCLFFIITSVFSQVDSLESRTEFLEIKQKELKDELTKLEDEISSTKKLLSEAKAEIILEDETGISATLTTNNNIYLLEDPSFTASKMMKLSSRDEIIVIGYYNNFYEVISQDHHGYIMDSFVRISDDLRILRGKIKEYSHVPKRSLRNSATSRRYLRGPRGGCYYINRSGNKTYVSRGLCN